MSIRSKIAWSPPEIETHVNASTMSVHCLRCKLSEKYKFPLFQLRAGIKDIFVSELMGTISTSNLIWSKWRVGDDNVICFITFGLSIAQLWFETLLHLSKRNFLFKCANRNKKKSQEFRCKFSTLSSSPQIVLVILFFSTFSSGRRVVYAITKMQTNEWIEYVPRTKI